MNPNLLIVDDEKPTRDGLRAALEDRPGQVAGQAADLHPDDRLRLGGVGGRGAQAGC